ncbi:MAG TPA: CheB methylesterase domain-containing protein [Polyangiaceae bacterium]
MPAEPVLVVLFCGSGAPADLAARLTARGSLEVVAQVMDVAAAARACTSKSARIVLLVADDARAAQHVTALMEKIRVPVVVLAQSSKAAMAAMAAGAVEALPIGTPIEQIVESVRLMSAVSVVRRQRVIERSGDRAPSPPPPTPRAALEQRLVAIGASTGGPAALALLLGSLPAGFSAPVLVAQHMPDDYDLSFASWVSVTTKLRVKVAEDGEEVRPGTVYLAQGGRDLVIVASRQLMNLVPAKKGPVPSADRLLESASRLVGVSLFGAILSGMGHDGAAGLLAMRRAGAVTLVQDAASCVVSSMPDAALDARAATLALSPLAIAEQLLSWASVGRESP